LGRIDSCGQFHQHLTSSFLAHYPLQKITNTNCKKKKSWTKHFVHKSRSFMLVILIPRLHLQLKMFIFCVCFLIQFTNDSESGSPDQRRICWDKTFVNSGIVQIGKLNLKFPIVGLFVKYLQSSVTNVFTHSFTCLDLKSTKRLLSHHYLFTLLGSACLKAVRKTSVKSTPGIERHCCTSSTRTSEGEVCHRDVLTMKPERKNVTLC